MIFIDVFILFLVELFFPDHLKENRDDFLYLADDDFV